MFEYYCTACQEKVESKTRIDECPLCGLEGVLLLIRGGMKRKVLRITIRCSDPQLWSRFIKGKGKGVTAWKALEKLINKE